MCAWKPSKLCHTDTLGNTVLLLNANSSSSKSSDETFFLGSAGSCISCSVVGSHLGQRQDGSKCWPQATNGLTINGEPALQKSISANLTLPMPRVFFFFFLWLVLTPSDLFFHCSFSRNFMLVMHQYNTLQDMLTLHLGLSYPIKKLHGIQTNY